jgi:hypothetical protein
VPISDGGTSARKGGGWELGDSEWPECVCVSETLSEQRQEIDNALIHSQVSWVDGMRANTGNAKHQQRGGRAGDR